MPTKLTFPEASVSTGISLQTSTSVPQFVFESDPTSGLLYDGGDLQIVVQGSTVAQVSQTSLVCLGNVDVVGVIAGSGQQGLTGLNVAASPAIANVEITNGYWSTLFTSVLLADSSSEYAVINGTNFSPGTAVQVVSNSSSKNALAVSYNGSTQLRAHLPSRPAGVYQLTVITPTGATASTSITYSNTPTWVTQSDLGNVSWNVPFSVQLEAIEPDTGGAITYAYAPGIFLNPPQTTLSNNGVLSGTITSVTSNTSYTFYAEAMDAQDQTSVQEFQLNFIVTPFLGGALSASSLYDVMENMAPTSSETPTAGGTLTLNGVSVGSYDYTIRNASVVPPYFLESDWFTSTEDTRSSLIKIFGDLTIPVWMTLQPNVRKLFTVIYVAGNLYLDGSISMKARGANHSLTPSGNVVIYTGTLDDAGTSVTNPYIPSTGGTGAASVTSSAGTVAGNAGGSAAGGAVRATGGGGSGGIRQNYSNGLTTTGGSGSAGTSFSGGSGGGGAWSNQGGNGGNAIANGGAGGSGYINNLNNNGGVSGNNPYAGGGAGNPGGTGVGLLAEPPNLSTASGSGTGPFTLNGYTIRASSVWSSTYAPPNAFNKTNLNFEDCWHSGQSTTLPQWIQLDLPTEKKFVSYAVSGRLVYDVSPRSWEIQGSDTKSWYTVDTRTNDTSVTLGGTATFTIANPGFYQYYRMYITASSNGTYVGIAELEFYESANNDGESGTGGTLVIFVKGSVYGSGTVIADGSNGGTNAVSGNAGVSGGGASGGGSVTLIAGQNLSTVTVSAAGGIGGAGGGSCADGTCPGGSGGAGGDGTASVLTIV